MTYGRGVRELKEPKTKASRRTLPLDPRAVAALRRLRKLETEERLRAGEAYSPGAELVFVDEIGKSLPPASVSAMFRRIVKATGLPPLTLHGLRHAFATVGLDEGIDVLYLAEVLGHSSPAITQSIYQHTRPERKTEAVARIGAAISG